MKIEKVTDTVLVQYLFNILIRETKFVSFEYSAGFKLRFEREEKTKLNEMSLPFCMILYPKANFWFNEKEEWESKMEAITILPKYVDNEEPLKAFYLMQSIGSVVKKSLLTKDGSITLELENYTLNISGNDDIFEESWIVEFYEGDNRKEDWFLSCDSSGNLYACLPEELLKFQDEK